MDLLVVGMTEKDAERLRDIFRLPGVYILIVMHLNQAGSLICDQLFEGRHLTEQRTITFCT